MQFLFHFLQFACLFALELCQFVVQFGELFVLYGDVLLFVDELFSDFFFFCDFFHEFALKSLNLNFHVVSSFLKVFFLAVAIFSFSRELISFLSSFYCFLK